MSKPTTKGGRIPASQMNAVESSDFSHEDLDFNRLKLDPGIQKFLRDQGLVWRFINYKKYTTEGNFHAAGWRPAKIPAELAAGAVDFNFGRDPEGYLRRGDLVLATRSVGLNNAHKAKLRQRTAAQSGELHRKTADEIKQTFKESGYKGKVYEGFEENE